MNVICREIPAANAAVGPTPNPIIYAGIGSRETPNDILHMIRAYAASAAQYGWRLRTGAAQGADQAFMNGCVTGGGRAEVYLPWPTYEHQSWIARPDFSIYGDVSGPAFAMAAHYHPAWAACSAGAQKLHARNCYIIMGRDLRTPVDMVVCWTQYGRVCGGTGQALRIAMDHGIKIINFGDVSERCNAA